MDSYIDIVVKPDAEMPINRLLNTLYTKFHKALDDLNANGIGASFPRYSILLGNCLRLHGAQTTLAELQSLDWIGGLIGYCKITDIQSVPEGVKHRTVSRIQSNMTESKLRRLIKRGSMQEGEAKKYKAKMFTQGIDNPFLELDSASNGNSYRRYIAFGDLVEKPIEGEFDTFGLSKTATIPWF